MLTLLRPTTPTNLAHPHPGTGPTKPGAQTTHPGRPNGLAGPVDIAHSGRNIFDSKAAKLGGGTGFARDSKVARLARVPGGGSRPWVWLVLFAVFGVGSLMFTACSGPGREASDLPPPAPPTVPAASSVPVTPASEAQALETVKARILPAGYVAPSKPLYPELGKQHDDIGATAVAEYFTHAYAWAFGTGDTQPVELVSTSNCKTCEEIVKVGRKAWGTGGAFSNWTPPKLTHISTGYNRTDFDYYMVDTQVEAPKYQVFDKDGKLLINAVVVNGIHALLLKYEDGRFLVDAAVLDFKEEVTKQ